MFNSDISRDAEKDLQDIARYTLNNGGKTLFKQYQKGLKKKFEAIGLKKVIERRFSRKFSELLVTKYRFHFILLMQSQNLSLLLLSMSRGIL